jgi:hypothetical protein
MLKFFRSIIEASLEGAAQDDGLTFAEEKSPSCPKKSGGLWARSM